MFCGVFSLHFYSKNATIFVCSLKIKDGNLKIEGSTTKSLI